MSFEFKSVVSRSKDESGTRVFHACEQMLARRLESLLQDAELSGFVITVNLESQEPLAMGNYRMVGHVRPGR